MRSSLVVTSVPRSATVILAVFIAVGTTLGTCRRPGSDSPPIGVLAQSGFPGVSGVFGLTTLSITIGTDGVTPPRKL
ncbi:hypothetical protein BATDEDRAFT_91235 [Batrachochytrium dendrobatidis JAM81]|uniref:Uncharacterized protein n=1 Tax=Batrachochytrium dendrobatidis (strain JAM81 / FGSC 10211) TaxID=684364 RepID=F4P9N1_BATDJ|nr:uncharacterized protein BATDEDRAFT_91235 [Batrachochytrium dendrobatidis JAM81]EGF77949.1 hypothetical protein BATDEDRAFT_91235 [Batrachochytrium dendrobatidis JAM81]|eukprot:XP_006681524.1 hypothetical protein BATDEDRAFT_91235 [Batrachochytrium dendrobatidis JAM81]